MSASYLNHHLKKRIRLGKIAIQNNILLCISAGPMLSSVSAALWWKGCVSTAFATSIFLAFSKSTDNNKADSNNNYKGSNQIYGLTLKSCVSDFMVGRSSHWLPGPSDITWCLFSEHESWLIHRLESMQRHQICISLTRLISEGYKAVILQHAYITQHLFPNANNCTAKASGAPAETWLVLLVRSRDCNSSVN